MREERLTPAIQAVADALAASCPTDPGINRDDLLFRAVALAARCEQGRRLTLWRRASAALAAGLALALFLRPSPQEITRVVSVNPPTEAVAAPVQWPDPAQTRAYLVQRQRLLQDGLAALPLRPVARLGIHRIPAYATPFEWPTEPPDRSGGLRSTTTSFGGKS